MTTTNTTDTTTLIFSLQIYGLGKERQEEWLELNNQQSSKENHYSMVSMQKKSGGDLPRWPPFWGRRINWQIFRNY
eukprot:9880395-Ditylum_brightwellii.AAC.1